MADRILNWYIEDPKLDGSSEGIEYILEQSYALPGKVIILAKKAPDGGDLQIDIKDDGVSIFSQLPTIPKGQSEDTDWDDFDDDQSLLAQYSKVTLVIPQSGGAKGISVSLELFHTHTEDVKDELQ